MKIKIKKDYIKTLIRKKSFKQKEVASKIGVSTQDWNNWMYRSTFPHYNKLEELAIFLDVKADDLVVEENFNEPNTHYKTSFNHPTAKTISFYDLDAKATLGVILGNEENQFPSDQVYIPGVSADLIVPFFGKEMEPIISSGDFIALRKISDHSFFSYGNIYLVATEEQVIIRYIKASSKRNNVILAAHNEGYDDIEIATSKFKAIYLVVSTIKRQVI